MNQAKPSDAVQPMVVQASNVSKVVSTSEGELRILAGIDLEINAGESLALIGASGSGKTTLLGILAGLDEPTSGVVRLGPYELTALDEEQRAKARGELVGFVFQTFQLLESLTALENVMLPSELRGNRDAREQAVELLSRVGLEHRHGHYPRQLSGGEQQRVAVARAFAAQPKVLFADEPTGNLDTATGGKIVDLIFSLNQAFATTLVLVTHDASLAARCDRSVTIAFGEISK